MTVLEPLFAAWNKHEVEAGVELFADEMVYRDQALGQTHSSKEELTANLRASFAVMPDVKFQLTSAFEAGRFFGGEVTMTGTRPKENGKANAAGPTFTVLYGVIGELDDDRKITRLVEYWNPAEFTGQ